VWVNGYMAMVRDMLSHQFDFFLDEMVILRNERTLVRLHDKGYKPYHVPWQD
jgi:hypothetical protein